MNSPLSLEAQSAIVEAEIFDREIFSRWNFLGKDYIWKWCVILRY